MNGNYARQRAVSTNSTAVPADDDIAVLVKELNTLDLSTWPALRDNLTSSGVLLQLRYRLKDESSEHDPRDVFRRAKGFQAFVRAIRCLAVACESETTASLDSKDVLNILDPLLLLLEAGLAHHTGNNRYFRTRITDGGGWKSLHRHLSRIASKCLQSTDASVQHLERFYGALFATAVGIEVLQDIYTNVARACPPRGRSWSLRSAEEIEENMTKQMENVGDVAVPDVLPIIVYLWLDHLRIAAKSMRTINLAIPTSIKILLKISRQNIVEAHLAGLLSAITPLLFDGQHSLVEKSLFRDIAVLLFQQGVANLDEAYFFFSKAATSAAAASFLLEGIRVSRQAPSIQFDLSRYGSSSIELPTLRRNFPPENSEGYTIALWAKFDEFDDEAHTTLFGAFDKTQTCFVLAYLEKDSHHLIFQTAIKGTRPSVRFKVTKFRMGTWYHICIVHSKPKITSASKAMLYVDGLFVEQVKANFPSVPPGDRASGPAKVQAFFGTPQDLSPAKNGHTCMTLWSLGLAALFSVPLSEDFISVMYYLGPAYHGNMQDCLGSFQTYAASAALNFRNESLNAGNESSSQLTMAIRHKASTVLSEDNILLNVSPGAILDSDDRNTIDESQLIKALSKSAAKNLHAYTRAGANAVVVNGAVPAINDALLQSNGIAMLMGEPTVTVPQSLDDASWRLGNCAPIVLSLVNNARTTEEVAVTVDILLETVKSSWRNSEVMERNSGYGILSTIIKDKLVVQTGSNQDLTKTGLALATPGLDRSALALRLLKSILSFLGYNDEEPKRSMITNPLAYKVLLIDNSIWRNHSYETQELYFKQFVLFAKESVHASFNLKRLSRMRVLRRLLEALKSETVSRAIMPAYSAALSALLPSAQSAEMLRSIALFITYSVHKRSFSGRLRKTARSRASSGSGTSTPLLSGESVNLNQFEIGVEVLRLYSDMLCAKNDQTMIKKFARTVTNKWLLYLLSETSPDVVVLSMRVLARLLVVHGDAYVKKFNEKSGGFAIIAHRLKRWWHLPALWPTCFAILFGADIGELDLDRSFDLFSFVDLFDSKKEYGIVYPKMFAVITGMLQSGLKTIVSSKHLQAPPHLTVNSPSNGPPVRLSMSTMAPPNPLLTIVTPQNVETFNTIVRFLADLQSRSKKFREYASTSSYTQGLLLVLFPVVVGSDVVEASVELNARDSMLSFDGAGVVVQPLSAQPPIVKQAENTSDASQQKRKALRRGSSFVIVSQENVHTKESDTLTGSAASPGTNAAELAENNAKHVIVQSILEIVVSLFVDQILTRKEFTGLGLFLKTPPGFIEHQTFFESWLLRNTVSQLSNTIALDQKVLCEPKVLTNLARFFSHLGEALFEGWFVGGAESVLDLAASVLEHLQRPDISGLKSVRLCAQNISVIRAVVFRVVLLTLSNLEEAESLAFLKKLAYWQNVLLASEEAHSMYLQLICYLLYGSLTAAQRDVRLAAADLWRTLLVQKPAETAAILSQASTAEQKQLVLSFEKLAELDNDTFLAWVDDHKKELDAMFFDTLSKSWDTFVTEENAKTEDSAKGRVSRRQEKLKIWAREELDCEELLRRHDVTFDHWTSNIHSSETLKHQRLVQDHHDDLVYTNATFTRMQRELARATGLFSKPDARKWRVDQTEGRNRMRLRLIEDFTYDGTVSQPKRKGSDMPPLRLDTKGLRLSTAETIGVTPSAEPVTVHSPAQAESSTEPFPEVSQVSDNFENIEIEESFELVEDPNAGQDDFEDKNRKVMRSLHRGDQVKHVANISRVAGLEAVEGLLIVGKDYVYLIDGFFQRADGEIVHVWQAPSEERDPYVGMISGRDVSIKKPAARDEEHETRSWKWSDVISTSKRRFLFRDVALEMFFGDGRSYLLTMRDSKSRNELYSLVNSKAPQYGNPDSPESEVAWRYEALKSVDDEPQGLGARFASVFAQSSHLAATKKWQKGEMSNFHYLMLINTLAGRTYNDLTQYPVFPWVLADYTSEVLDLEDSKSFRDLSKPMGCQHAGREAEFRERFQQFAEMGDSNAPPFHYGTHYSSAMIVTSYLIRLQPFVKSYLLLQGGTFDHPDRMFFSIAGAWQSASRTNMTDVRELTPEFFYLPEFLTNINEYDFGTRQNNSKTIENVALPPWAKGDPKIFIAKQREALESPHVSKNLHKWIDLVFGCKQKGEAAVEAVNVFHHLSYQGARDLDAIDDPVERLATIGIIHNFGQTPYQIFPRAHPPREHIKHKYKRLDSAAESLTRIPGALLESEERVASLTYSWRSDKLLCSGAFRLNIPPFHDKYMEWGFSDNSIRFYAADSRKQIGLFEHLHVGQLSCALFADSKTLITAGTDCTIAVWSVHSNGIKSIELQPKATLYGHRSTVTHLAISRSFNALLSCSSNGGLFLWDLNRCEFVRRIQIGGEVEIGCAAINDITGNVIACHGSTISIFTLNGDLLTYQDTSERRSSDEDIISVACYEGASNEWLERDIILTGHKRGVVKVWSKIINKEGEFELELIRQLNHADPAREDGGNVSAGISCILPMPQVVYTGDEDGRVVEWNCVQRH